MKNFIDDYDKMKDFFAMKKSDFLKSYSYLTEDEYNATLKEFTDGKINKDVIKVNSTVFNVYEDAWLNNKKQPFDYNLLYYQKDDNFFVALDNSTGDCWVEEFDNETQVIDWLTLDYEEYDKKYDNSYKREDLLYISQCVDYSKLKDVLTNEELQEIDEILYDFHQYQFKYGDGKRDIVSDYKQEYGNASVIDWYEGLKDTEEFLDEFKIDNKEQNIEL